jgi:hypothetical protein
MKLKSSFAMFASLVLLTVGCSDDPASGTTANGSVGAKVGGGAWTATNVQSTWASNVLQIGGSEISGGNNRQINLNMMASAPGTYQINPFAGTNATYTEGSGASVKIFSGTTGQIVVTTLSSSGATGTFSFSATESQGGSETRSITEGTFDVKF